jgi:hypothetical protein
MYLIDEEIYKMASKEQINWHKKNFMILY